MRVRQPDGRYEWVSAQAQCHADADGHCEDVVVTARNITARRRTAVGHDATDLKRLEQQLLQAQKMETVGRLAGGVAHDFNNLLTIILGSLELLRLGGPGRSAAHLENIETAATQASHLTRQLLAFSRQQIVEPRVVDLNELITDARRMLVRLINEDIELTTLPRPDLWKVCVDPMQVMQVLVNLVVNARDAMPRGGKLTIETDNVLVDSAYLDGHAHVMPGRFRDARGQRHRRRHRRRSEARICSSRSSRPRTWGRARAWGWRRPTGSSSRAAASSGRTARKAPARPSRCICRAPPMGWSRRRKCRAPTRRRCRAAARPCWCVEDSDLLRQMASETLLRQGYTVLAARDGVEALNLLARDPRPVHLLLTDVIMPKMSGRELAGRFRLLLPDVRVLYMTGYASDAIVHHGVLEPGVEMLQKPYTPLALIRRVQEVLHGRTPLRAGAGRRDAGVRRLANAPSVRSSRAACRA